MLLNRFMYSISLMFISSLALASPPQIIEMTQTGCQFLEAEQGIDHGYATSSIKDCQEINDSSAEQRLKNSATLTLKPGKYIFRVKNRDVPYPLGFWLRGDGVINRARLPSVSGGGLVTGKSRDYQIDLKPGEYVYSCPLNPTPDYKIVVEG
jgi:hypothetical protein